MVIEEFEKIVEEAIERIPQKLRNQMSNVVIVIEDLPSREQEKKLNLKGHTLFGLYEGIPLTKRGNHYAGVVPDKITIFKKSIERYARTEQAVREQVFDTVWHEIAHHFGISEEGIKNIKNNKNTYESKNIG